MRAKSPLVPTKPLARRRGVLGRRSRFTTALQPPNPRRGACARKVPTWRLNCRCPSARRGGVGVEVRGASSQRWLCRVPIGGVVLCVAFPQRVPLGFPPPRPIGSCLARPQSCPCSCHRARVAVCGGCSSASLCFAPCADNSARSGAARSAKPPKTERGGSVPNEFAPNLPRSVYRAVPCGHFASLVRSTFGLRDFPPNRRVAAHLRRICGGRRPRSNEAGTIPRTANRETGVVCASRGLRLSASAILA